MATSPSFTPAPSWKTWRAPVGIPTFTLEFPSSGPDDSDNACNGTECWRTRQSFLSHCSSDRSFSLRAWRRGDLSRRIQSSAGTTDASIPSTSVLLQKIVASLDHVIEHVVGQKILIVDQCQHFGCEDLEIISRNVLNFSILERFSSIDRDIALLIKQKKRETGHKPVSLSCGPAPPPSSHSGLELF